MLAFLARYRPPQACALVLDQPVLVELIFSYLDVGDLRIVGKVCALWRTVVYADPYHEVRILRYALIQASHNLKAYRQHYGKLLLAVQPPPYKSLALPFKPVLSIRSPLVTARNQLEAEFKSFAKSQGFTPHRHTDFASDTDFVAFAISIQACYNRFMLYRNTNIAKHEAEIQRQGRGGRRGGIVGVVRRWVKRNSEWEG